ncbi:MAG: ABC transporter ATP-binding protein [Nitrospinota bacterium]
MTEIRLQGVEKRFQDVVVVEDLTLTIHAREFFTFVGPSGCGKSTILNMIAGLEEVTGGAISFDAERIDHLSPRERDVALVFQSYALYPHMTVYENLAFPLRVRKAAAETIDGEIQKVAGLLELGPLLQRKPRELSGGQQQRVALGRAIVRRPRAFLMDEPLSNLDARLRVEMRAELKRIHRECQITTVYVTHDQEEAMALSDRIAVLNEGTIHQCGDPMEVYEQPANLFVASFIGSPPMNLMDGALLQDISLFAPLLERAGKQEIVVGIRPSDITVRPHGGGPALEAEVLLLEPTGSEVWVDGLWRGITLKGRATPETPLRPGATAFFTIPVDKLHLFDKSTGSRLALPP